jgi:diacylglycerol kinase family enzyme
MLRVYPGPAPLLALDAVRWLARRQPTAPGVTASVVELGATDGRPIPLQADGDLLGERTEWRFEIRPAAVRLIGHWR